MLSTWKQSEGSGSQWCRGAAGERCVSGMVGWRMGPKSTTMALQRVASGKDYAPRPGATCAAD